MRLVLIQALLLGALAAIGFVAWNSIDNESRSGQALATLSRAQRFHLSADMMHDALRADVNGALRVTSANSAAAGEVIATVHDNSSRFESDLDSLANLALPDDLEQTFAAGRLLALAYIATANELVMTAVRNHDQGVALEAQFSRQFDDLLKANYSGTLKLAEYVDMAEREALAAAALGKLAIAITSVLTGLIAWTFVALLASSIRGSLRKVSDAARALAAGNLSARSVIASQDEVGELAGSLNKMADDLQIMIGRLLADADRDAFSSHLIQALEMANNEGDLLGVIGRAMAQIGTLPSELLLSDGTQSSLQRKVTHPTAGAPGCGVEALANCVAIRRGTPLVFDDSGALNACPRLSNRPSGPMSAVCVPVAFMGRSFGVLHTGGQVRVPPSPKLVAQLTVLGTQAGARIGTVRAFTRTQQHAYTDVLTSLSNRRALEQVVEELHISGSAYAVAIADLDYFKGLNDAHGHEAGDKALRQFAEVLRKSIRQGDHAARWGGEEFAILFADATAAQAFEVIERIRADLAQLLGSSDSILFTSSFGLSDSTMASSFEDILRIADDALYTSKHAGRDRATIGAAVPIAPEAQPAEDVSSVNSSVDVGSVHASG